MADKYLRHGATYCGDGTTSAAAASAGAAGAWNDRNVLFGTAPAYGTLAAGDTVFIRSKDAADAAMTVTAGATVTIGNTAATLANPITWVLDGGVVWSGIDGVFTIETPSTYSLNCAAYNRFIADTRLNWVHRETNVNASKSHFGTHTSVYVENWLLDYSLATASWGIGMGSQSGGGGTVNSWVNCKFKLGKHSGYFAFFRSYYGIKLLLVNPEIELTVLDTAAGVFYPNDGTGLLQVQGGCLYGVGATTGYYLFPAAVLGGQSSELIGFKYPATVGVYKAVTVNVMAEAAVVGGDGVVGGTLDKSSGRALSRLDGYYPTLDARMPDSANTPWSWWVYPFAASKLNPFNLVSSKLYTAAAATKTITLQVLVSDPFTAINKSNLFAVISYIDSATGVTKSLSTRVSSGGALDTSTANWSATSYPSVSLSKKSFSITTPTSIKQDSLIMVNLFCEVVSASANDVIIMCPDFTVA